MRAESLSRDRVHLGQDRCPHVPEWSSASGESVGKEVSILGISSLIINVGPHIE